MPHNLYYEYKCSFKNCGEWHKFGKPKSKLNRHIPLSSNGRMPDSESVNERSNRSEGAKLGVKWTIEPNDKS